MSSERPPAGGDDGGSGSPMSQWRPVAPSGDEPPTALPKAVRYGGLGLLALLLVAAVLVGIALGGGFRAKEADPTSQAPALSLEPPVQVGDFVRGSLGSSEGPAPDHQRIVRADYSDGKNQLVLLLTFPESDVVDFLTAAGIEHPDGGVVTLLDGVSCGVSADTTLPACGKVVENTGILVVSLTDASEEDARARLDAFTDAVTA